MARKPVALVTSTTTHGGVITLVGFPNRPKAGGVKIVLKTDTIACPTPGHGTTTITLASTKTNHGGQGVVYETCTTSCGATIINGDPDVLISE